MRTMCTLTQVTAMQMLATLTLMLGTITNTLIDKVNTVVVVWKGVIGLLKTFRLHHHQVKPTFKHPKPTSSHPSPTLEAWPMAARALRQGPLT